MLSIDLTGKRALVVGVAEDTGYGFAIAKALHQAGATVCLGVWPQMYGVFSAMLARGKLDASLMHPDGTKLTFEALYPLDAAFDTFADMPEDVREHRRYKEHGDVSISAAAQRMRAAHGEGCVDIVVHSLANGPEVKKPLLETSRAGYLSAVSVSAYSLVSMVQHFGPLMAPDGSFLSLSYIAGERVVPGYGGGMSSAKAALENDTRVLAYEAGRKWGHRVNTISAGPLASRAASSIGPIDDMIAYCKEHTALADSVQTADVAGAALFLASPLARAITASTLYVDMGFHAMAGPHLDLAPLPAETP